MALLLGHAICMRSPRNAYNRINRAKYVRVCYSLWRLEHFRDYGVLIEKGGIILCNTVKKAPDPKRFDKCPNRLGSKSWSSSSHFILWHGLILVSTTRIYFDAQATTLFPFYLISPSFTHSHTDTNTHPKHIHWTKTGIPYFKMHKLFSRKKSITFLYVPKNRRCEN